MDRCQIWVKGGLSQVDKMTFSVRQSRILKVWKNDIFRVFCSILLFFHFEDANSDNKPGVVKKNDILWVIVGGSDIARALTRKQDDCRNRILKNYIAQNRHSCPYTAFSSQPVIRHCEFYQISSKYWHFTRLNNDFRRKNNDIFRASILLGVKYHFETVPGGGV